MTEPAACPRPVPLAEAPASRRRNRLVGRRLAWAGAALALGGAVVVGCSHQPGWPLGSLSLRVPAESPQSASPGESVYHQTAHRPASTAREAVGDMVGPARSWEYVILHHSATDTGTIEAIDRDHQQRLDESGRPWMGIGYHFVIGNGRGIADGLVEPTFRWRDQLAGAHAGKPLYNDVGIGVCLIGDFGRHAPTERQLTACRELLAELGERFLIPRERILRHSDVKPTQCPGALFPFDQLKSRLALVPAQMPGEELRATSPHELLLAQCGVSRQPPLAFQTLGRISQR